MEKMYKFDVRMVKGEGGLVVVGDLGVEIDV